MKYAELQQEHARWRKAMRTIGFTLIALADGIEDSVLEAVKEGKNLGYGVTVGEDKCPKCGTPFGFVKGAVRGCNNPTCLWTAYVAQPVEKKETK